MGLEQPKLHSKTSLHVSLLSFLSLPMLPNFTLPSLFAELEITKSPNTIVHTI